MRLPLRQRAFPGLLVIGQGGYGVHPFFVRSFRVPERVFQTSPALFLGVQVQAMQQVRAAQVERDPIGAGENSPVSIAGGLLAEALDPSPPVMVRHVEKNQAAWNEIGASVSEDDPAIAEAVISLTGRRIGEDEVYLA